MGMVTAWSWARGATFRDGVVIHADPALPVTVGKRVWAGHQAILHGCTMDDDVLVGMGATLLNGVRIGSGSVIAAGAVVLEGHTYIETHRQTRSSPCR